MADLANYANECHILDALVSNSPQSQQISTVGTPKFLLATLVHVIKATWE